MQLFPTDLFWGLFHVNEIHNGHLMTFYEQRVYNIVNICYIYMVNKRQTTGRYTSILIYYLSESI